MNQSHEEKIIEEVRNIVFVDQKIVTFNYISKQYGLSIPQAKEILRHIVNELTNEGRKDFIASHYITGYSKDSNPDASRGEEDFLRYNVMEADDDEVDEHKESFFSRVDSVVLRSVRSSEIKRDRDLYAKPDERAIRVEPVKVGENGTTKKKPASSASDSKPVNGKSTASNSTIVKSEPVPVKTKKLSESAAEVEKSKEKPKSSKVRPQEAEKVPEIKPEKKVKQESSPEQNGGKSVKQQENELKRKSVSEVADVKPSMKKSKKDEKASQNQQKRITDFFRR